jgi:hypothetical protein
MSNAPMGESRNPKRKLTSGHGFARLNGGGAPQGGNVRSRREARADPIQ